MQTTVKFTENLKPLYFNGKLYGSLDLNNGFKITTFDGFIYSTTSSARLKSFMRANKLNFTK